MLDLAGGTPVYLACGLSSRYFYPHLFEEFTDIKNELPRQRCAVWIQYAYQLEEMESAGTISDRRLYLNRSNYDKLPALWRKDLDVYLDGCRNHYTVRTLELIRIYCSDVGLHFAGTSNKCFCESESQI